jgi:hypothetical protein
MGDDFEPVASAAVVQVWRWGDGHRVLSNERDMNFSERTSSQRPWSGDVKTSAFGTKTQQYFVLTFSDAATDIKINNKKVSFLRK